MKKIIDKSIKFLLKFIILSLIILSILLLIYSYYKKNNQLEAIQLAMVDPSYISLADYKNNKTPKDLFAHFFIMTPSLMKNHYKNYYGIIECISPYKPDIYNEMGYKQFENIEKLFFAIIQTDFKMADIPSEPSSDHLELTLGSDKNKQTFYLAKKDNGDWYFTEKNFNNPKTLQKFKRYLASTSQYDTKHLNMPLIAFCYFMFGINNEFGFSKKDARQVMDLSWIPSAVQDSYGDFIAYAMVKVFESVKINFSEIPGMSPENSDTIVLYVSPTTKNAICMVKQYDNNDKKSYKWVFPKWSQVNAMEIYYQSILVANTRDPFWYNINHDLWECIPILKHKEYGKIFAFILISIFSIIIGWLTYRLSKFLLYYCFTYFNHYTNNHQIKYSKKLEITGSLLVGLSSGGYFFMNSIIVYGYVYLWFYYIYEVVFRLILLYLLLESINMTFEYITAFYKKINKNANLHRITFVLSIFNKLINLIVIVIILGCIMNIVGINMIHYLTALGIGSIAVALAGKDTIENLFGSIMLAMERPFDIGDWIIIGNKEGFVEKIGLRSTKIRSFEHSLLIIPNFTFITTEIDNMGARLYRRYKTTLDIKYSTPLEKLEEYVKGIDNIIKSKPFMSNKEYNVRINDLGEYSIKVLVYVFFVARSWKEELKYKEKFIVDIIKLAEEMNIEFAYPVQTLLIEKNKEINQRKNKEETNKPSKPGFIKKIQTNIKNNK